MTIDWHIIGTAAVSHILVGFVWPIVTAAVRRLVGFDWWTGSICAVGL